MVRRSAAIVPARVRDAPRAHIADALCIRRQRDCGLRVLLRTHARLRRTPRAARTLCALRARHMVVFDNALLAC